MVFGGRFRIRRCNSKASYLPRQSLEKLNNSDPDHGSYKLTLTSNEDLVAPATTTATATATTKMTSTKQPAYDILLGVHGGAGKLPHPLPHANNLPDVLPLGAKLQQPSSPTASGNDGGGGGGGGGGAPTLRYGSNNNLQSGAHSPPTQQLAAGYALYPSQHRYSSPAMVNVYNNNNNNSNNSSSCNYARSQSYDMNSHSAGASSNNNNNNKINSNHSPTKFMSQSSIDLKIVPHNSLEPTLEEPSASPLPSPALLSPAQSENNLSSATSRSSAARREFHREEPPAAAATADGRLFRAELVNTTLSLSSSSSPSASAANVHKTVTRKDSLRENIEKITQLQSQLMSAHLAADTTLLRPLSVASAKSPATTPTPPPSLISEAIEEAEATAPTDSEDSNAPPALPQTPPPSAATDTGAVPTQIAQMDTSIDGLRLMQRSEIVLRVHPATTEAASQTDELPEDSEGGGSEQPVAAPPTSMPTRTTLQPRQRHPIELDCDRMFAELAALLAPSDRLLETLAPPTIKTAADYVSDLYNPNVALRACGKRDVGTSTLLRMRARESLERNGAVSPTSLPVVSMAPQYAEVELSLSNGGADGAEHDAGDDDGERDVVKCKMDELIKQLNRKIRILSEEQATVGDESSLNDTLGQCLLEKFADRVRPIEATKFRTYIDDIGHMTSLLLSLSQRLAKAENSLSAMTDKNASEKKLLEAKRDRLLEQLDEAKRLKEDIDRRGSTVAGMLEKHLSAEQYADFDYFINMKAKLIADARDISDKIKCGEEQLTALSEALIQSDC